MNNDRKIEVSTEELEVLYKLLADMNDFFHQPMNLEKIETVQNFMKDKDIYERIHDAYYDYVWDWIPKDIQEKIIEEN